MPQIFENVITNVVDSPADSPFLLFIATQPLRRLIDHNWVLFMPNP
jgi:hypothetical protein